MLIFHIATEADWAAAHMTGSYETSTFGVRIQEVGFMHASRASQTAGVLARYYAGVDEPLTLLTIDTDRLTAPWQLDDVPGSAASFPHVYGPLNVSAVVDATALTRTAGVWTLPTLPAAS